MNKRGTDRLLFYTVTQDFLSIGQGRGKKKQVCSITKSHTLINQALFFFFFVDIVPLLSYVINITILLLCSILFRFRFPSITVP